MTEMGPLADAESKNSVASQILNSEVEEAGRLRVRKKPGQTTTDGAMETQARPNRGPSRPGQTGSRHIDHKARTTKRGTRLPEHSFRQDFNPLHRRCGHVGRATAFPNAASEKRSSTTAIPEARSERKCAIM